MLYVMGANKKANKNVNKIEKNGSNLIRAKHLKLYNIIHQFTKKDFM
jgi:hypothetical protein